jgi:hypothetical protein
MFKGCPANIANYCKCCSGPTGGVGPTGPTGPTGPSLPIVGFQTAYSDSPFASATILPLIGNLSLAGEYNSGMYDSLTGFVTVPSDGIYILNLNVQITNGASSYVSAYTATYRFNAVSTLYRVFSDRVNAGDDISNGSAFAIFLPASTTVELALSYSVVNVGPPAGPIRVFWGMSKISS